MAKNIQYPTALVEHNGVQVLLTPTGPDEWHDVTDESGDGFSYHYDLEDGMVYVYKIVNGKPDTSEAIHKQPINA